MTIAIISSVLALVGTVLVLRLPIKDSVRSLGERLGKISVGTPTLRQRLDGILGRAPEPFLKRLFKGAGGSAPPIVSVLSLVLALVGICVAAILHNIFLVPVLALLGYLIPVWISRVASIDRKAREYDELEAAMSIITSSYLKNGSIVDAVKENLEYIRNPIAPVFKQFITEVFFINSDLNQCLLHLKSSIDNEIFADWCDAVIEAQNDAKVRRTLLSKVNKFRTLREVQGEYNTEMRAAMRDFRYIILIVASSVPALYLLQREWFNVLVDTVVGKIALTILAIAVLLGLHKSFELSEPLNIKRKGGSV